MRPRDAEELQCQLPDGYSNQSIAIWCWQMSAIAWIAKLKGQPCMVFGVSLQQHPGLMSAWAWGTPSCRKTLPAVTQFIKETVIPRCIDEFNAHRVEIRSLSTHDYANRWLPKLGAVLECEMPHYGKGGESFNLWRITR